jgi:hypothetical protein
MTSVSMKAADALQLHRVLQLQAANAAGNVRNTLERSRRRKRHIDLIEKMTYHRRVALAIRGVHALSALAMTDDVQSLIRIMPTGGIVLWQLAPRLPGCRSVLVMTPDAIVLDDEMRFSADGPRDKKESTYARLPYQGIDLIYQRALEAFASPQDFDVATETVQHAQDPNDMYRETEILFQVLVDCADMKKMERYFLDAIRI